MKTWGDIISECLLYKKKLQKVSQIEAKPTITAKVTERT